MSALSLALTLGAAFDCRSTLVVSQVGISTVQENLAISRVCRIAAPARRGRADRAR